VQRTDSGGILVRVIKTAGRLRRSCGQVDEVQIAASAICLVRAIGRGGGRFAGDVVTMATSVLRIIGSCLLGYSSRSSLIANPRADSS
jgi:hypothetical protein